jgi:ppGpp synthetase/RelA/SpoT-type nucleotidyltranferase
MPKKASTFDKDKFSREYNKREDQFKDLKSEAVFTLEKKLNAAGIKFHSIPSRIKTLDSCLGKIEKNQFETPFEQMRDFVG